MLRLKGKASWSLRDSALVFLVLVSLAVVVQLTPSNPNIAERQQLALTPSGQMTASSTSLSAKESYGWFDDIPDEGWKLMKLRARTAFQYMNPLLPETGYNNPIMWYLNNLQVNRLFADLCII
jgi:hypothetical protein